MPEEPVYLYLLGCEGVAVHSKIGIAKNPEKRVKGLQCGNPNIIWLVSAWKFPTKAAAEVREKILHSVFRDFRATGEWFSVPPQLLRPFVMSVLNDISMGVSNADQLQEWSIMFHDNFIYGQGSIE